MDLVSVIKIFGGHREDEGAHFSQSRIEIEIENIVESTSVDFQEKTNAHSERSSDSNLFSIRVK